MRKGSQCLTILGSCKHVLSICPNSVTLMGLEHRDSCGEKNRKTQSYLQKWIIILSGLSHTAPQRLISAFAGWQVTLSLRSVKKKIRDLWVIISQIKVSWSGRFYFPVQLNALTRQLMEPNCKKKYKLRLESQQLHSEDQLLMHN